MAEVSAKVVVSQVWQIMRSISPNRLMPITLGLALSLGVGPSCQFSLLEGESLRSSTSIHIIDILSLTDKPSASIKADSGCWSES